MIGHGIAPFKGRDVDLSRPVRVFRNLTRRGVVYSVQQDGRTVGHTTGIGLRDAEFVVNAAGRDRVRRTGQKNVHAFAQGMVVTNGLFGCDPTNPDDRLALRLRYNPLEDDHFRAASTPYSYVFTAMGAVLNAQGLSCAYVNRSAPGPVKVCNVCDCPCLLSEFYGDSSRPDGLMSRCKRCDQEQQRRSRYERLAWVHAFMRERGCADCGERDPVVLQLDHVTGEKVAAVSQMVVQKRSLAAIKREAAKCVVRCANCHLRRHAAEHAELREAFGVGA